MSAILQSNETSYIFSLPQGKPDTRMPLQYGKPDTRPRIAQSSQKGPNCFWYSMNILRDRIGPNSGSDYEEARRVEKLCSNFYKNRTRFENQTISINLWLKTLKEKGWIFDGKKDKIKNCLPLLQVFLDKQQYQEIYTFLERFCDQNEFDDISEYSKKNNKVSEREIFLNFFKSLNINPKEKYHQLIECEIKAIETMIKDSIDNHELFHSFFPAWETVSNTLIQGISNIVAYEVLGFKSSDWSPQQSIDKLLKCLRLEGALVVGGRFGNALYANQPTLYETLDAQHQVYKWIASDRRIFNHPEDTVKGHCIVVVGASKQGSKGGLVYFVDPKDGSDPQNPLQRKMYVISYENFINNISDVRGSNTPDKTSVFPYALYYPKSEKKIGLHH